MNHSRRNFLKNAALLAAGHAPLVAGLSAMTTQAFAASLQEKSDFNFVLFRVIGGMDSILGIHPWEETSLNLSEKDLYLNYNPATQVMRNVAGTKISLGPSAFCLAPYVKQMAVIRGVYMGASDIGHPAAIQYISSGRAQDTAPHIIGAYGSKLADPSKFVTTNSPVQRGSLESFPILLTQTLKNLGSVADFTTKSLLNYYKRQDLPVQRYLDLLKQKDKLQKFEEIRNSQNNSDGKVLDETVALAMLASGLTRVVQLDLVDELHTLDTHGNHMAHLGFQQMRWERIANFLKGLSDAGLMEKTLVAVVTEFNRSPGKNASDGKDHNYTDNAVALFGRNVNGGHVAGDHKLYVPLKPDELSFWSGNYINYKTGAVTEFDVVRQLQVHNTTGKMILPENVGLIRPADVWATVSNSLDPSLIKNLASDAAVIPGVFKRT